MINHINYFLSKKIAATPAAIAKNKLKLEFTLLTILLTIFLAFNNWPVS